ncbi:MAG: DUF1996 domain-containing protein [Actinomycetota bacterium]
MKRTVALSVTLVFAAVLIGVSAIPASAGSGVFSITGCTDAGLKHDDPIVMPGDVGMSHLHQFFGNETTNANSTLADMVVGTSSCPLSADTAGYWAPALLDPNSQPVPLLRATAYYRATSAKGSPIVAFPPDFRMIAGSPALPTGTPKVLGWGCDDTTYLPTIPNCGASTGKKFVKAHIVFPSCWDGLDLGITGDHRGHVAYPIGSKCPSTHPTRLPRLSLHFTWNTAGGTGYSIDSDISAGTTAGQSLHADFWNTWNQGALEILVNTCLNAGKSCAGMTDANFRSKTGFTL